MWKYKELYDRLGGDVYLYEQLYRAQLAFYRGQFEEAESLMLKVDGNARKNGCVLVQLGVAEYQGRLAVHMRRPVEWTRAYDFISSMQKHENPFIKELALYVKCQMWMQVGLVSNVPEWIREGRFGVVQDHQNYRLMSDRVSHCAFPFAWQMHMKYLLYSGNFTRLINAADMADSFFGLSRMPLYACSLWLDKASAWKALGDNENAKECVGKAMEILAPDGLWLFAAEFIPILGEHLIREIEPYGTEAMDIYMKYAKEYPIKLAVIRKFMTEGVFREPLTEKEQTVARLAALGFKSKELADYLSISSNTVKFHLSNIYKKLGIKNRVELKSAMERYMEKEYAFWIEMTKDE
ncbi:MAG: helix-turn-helix transcriptional regulator [Lachnospiraceae bacterium]|nr:helix-turn-helix transcriptional regulator [Lachnospiraceae bacterium]